MFFGCCTSIENYDLLARKGYDRIILSAAAVSAMDSRKFTAACRKVSEGPLSCRALNDFCKPELTLCGPGYDERSVEQYSLRLAERAHDLGVEYLGIGAPKSRNIPAGFPREEARRQLKRTLAIACQACRPYGMAVLLEAVCSLECNFITTTDEAAGIVAEMGEDNLHLVFDIYHAFMMREDAAPLRRAMQHVKLVHIAQDMGGERHYLRAENDAEYRIYCDALSESGYDGEVSVEAFFDDPEEQLSPTLSILRRLGVRHG